jgi:hypothetical protein
VVEAWLDILLRVKKSRMQISRESEGRCGSSLVSWKDREAWAISMAYTNRDSTRYIQDAEESVTRHVVETWINSQGLEERDCMNKLLRAGEKQGT